jgi:hypothetical protein
MGTTSSWINGTSMGDEHGGSALVQQRNRVRVDFSLVGENATQLRREDIRGRDSSKFAQRKEALAMAI